MKLLTSRFGEIEYKDQDLLHFNEGLLGFEELKSFLLIPFDDNPAFYWLQSIEDGKIAFLVINPFLFFPDYELELDEKIKAKLEITKKEQVAIYAICTIPGEDIKGITANLVGPLVVNIKNRFGSQYVLTGFQYHTKHPLFKKTKKLGVGS